MKKASTMASMIRKFRTEYNSKNLHGESVK